MPQVARAKTSADRVVEREQNKKAAALTAEKKKEDEWAKKAMAAGKYDKAVKHYDELLQLIDPNAHAERHVVLCNRTCRNVQSSGSFAQWHRAMTQPVPACLHTGSAAYTKLEKHVLAAEDARSALKGAPKGSVKAHYRLASALLAQGKYQVRLACPLI